MKSVTLTFDYISPYAYLALEAAPKFAREHGVARYTRLCNPSGGGASGTVWVAVDRFTDRTVLSAVRLR